MSKGFISRSAAETAQVVERHPKSNIAGLNREHVEYFKTFTPGDYFKAHGYREYSLIAIKFDERTLETAAWFELGLQVVGGTEVHTLEYRIRDGKPIRTLSLPAITMHYYQYANRCAERKLLVTP
ncbi:hypothetical protein [Rhizobium leguminosarum]|uniref:hypothetical protein n=1 Tax=Rhizobium leguminosarum TaxID=384 RepID=UPI000365E036|nr:hypothetical protein [Rhizobium leguminosarum]